MDPIGYAKLYGMAYHVFSWLDLPLLGLATVLCLLPPSNRGRRWLAGFAGGTLLSVAAAYFNNLALQFQLIGVDSVPSRALLYGGLGLHLVATACLLVFAYSASNSSSPAGQPG